MNPFVLEHRGRRAASLRWGACGLIVLAIHVGVFAALFREPEPVSTTTGGEPAMEVDLEPVEGEKAIEDMPPTASSGDPATAAAAAVDSAASVDAASPALPNAASLPLPESKVEPVQPPLPLETPKVELAPSPPSPEPSEVEPAPPPPSPEPPRIEPLPRPLPEPVKPQPVPPTPSPPSHASAASAAAAAADETAPTVQKLSAGREVAWRGSLVAHLNRFRHFSPGLVSGTVRVGFAIDAEGQISTIGIVAGSDNAALDEAALSLVRRASPFPKPPAGVTGKHLSFVVPIHFDGRRP